MTELEELISNVGDSLVIRITKNYPDRLVSGLKAIYSLFGEHPSKTIYEGILNNRKLVEISISGRSLTGPDYLIYHYCFPTAVHLMLNTVRRKDNCCFRCQKYHPNYCFNDQLRPHTDCKKGLHGYCFDKK